MNKDILNKTCRSCVVSEPCQRGNPPAIGLCTVTPFRGKKTATRRDWLLESITRKLWMNGGTIILRKSVKVICDDVSGPTVRTVRIIRLPGNASKDCKSFDIGDGDTSMQLGDEDLQSILEQI